jgi:hypothetical protein
MGEAAEKQKNKADYPARASASKRQIGIGYLRYLRDTSFPKTSLTLFAVET